MNDDDKNKIPIVKDDDMKVNIRQGIVSINDDDTKSIMGIKKVIISITPLEKDDHHSSKLVRINEKFPRLKEIFVVKGEFITGYLYGYIIEHDRVNMLYTITDDIKRYKKICFHYRNELDIVEPSIDMYLFLIKNNSIISIFKNDENDDENINTEIRIQCLQYDLIKMLSDYKIGDIEKGYARVLERQKKEGPLVDLVAKIIVKFLKGHENGIRKRTLFKHMRSEHLCDDDMIISGLQYLIEQNIVIKYKNNDKDFVILKDYVDKKSASK